MDNRGGVAGSIGMAAAVKSPPDGYTLVVGNVGPVAINHNIYRNVGYDPLKDFTPVTLAVTAPQLVVVHPSVPAKSFKEFTALVKSRKDKLNFGSSGPGSISHLAAETYKIMAKVDLVHIPYKGSALITTDLLGGHVDVVFSDMAVVLPHVQARTAPRAGGDRPRADPARAGRSHGGGIRRSRFRDDELVGHPRAGRNPGAGRHAVERRSWERSCSRATSRTASPRSAWTRRAARPRSSPASSRRKSPSTPS